jgi:hypothetical protein
VTRRAVLLPLLVLLVACGGLPRPGGDGGGSEHGAAVRPSFASFVDPGSTVQIRLPGWATDDEASDVVLAPMPDAITRAGGTTIDPDGTVRFALRVDPDAPAGDVALEARLVDATGAPRPTGPADVRLHVLPRDAAVRMDGDRLDVPTDETRDGWLVVEAELAPGERLAVVPYDPRERSLLSRLRIQGFGFEAGEGMALRGHGGTSAPALAPQLTDETDEPPADPHLAHLAREQRFLEQVDRLGLRPLPNRAGLAPAQAPPAQRRFEVLDLVNGGVAYVDATLEASSDHALVYVEDGYAPVEFEQPAEVAAAFDEIYADTRALWGEESDVDGNGRVVLLVTPRTGFQAYVRSADLYGANEGEIIYGATTTRNVLAHELTHVITNHRKRVLQNARPPTWEVEGIAVATEILLDMVPQWPFRTALERPWALRAFEPYGGPALLVLAAGEQAGGTAAGAWRALHDTPATGEEALAELAGVPFDTLFGDVAMALLLDGTPYQTDRYRFAGLDFAAIDDPFDPEDRLAPLAYNALPLTARAADLVNLRPFVSGPARGGTARVAVRMDSARAHLRVLRLPGSLPYRPDPERDNWRIEGGGPPTSALPYLRVEGRVGEPTVDATLTLFYEGDGEASFDIWNDEAWFDVTPRTGRTRGGDPYGVPLTFTFAPCTEQDPRVREAFLNLATNDASSAPTVAIVRYACEREPLPPTIHDFVAAATDVSPSSSTELRWAVSGQEPLEVFLEPGIGDVTGLTFLPVHPDATTVYRLVARNPHGEASAELIIGACPDPYAPIAVPDPVLARELRAALELSADAPLDCRAMAGLSVFEPLTTEIGDLTGLDAAVGLTELRLTGNRPDSFAPLADLTNLRVLRLSSTDLDDASVLSDLRNLTHLEMPYNLVRDVTPLTSLDDLRTLLLAGNPLASTAPLADMPWLRWLSIDGTATTDLDFLAGLPELHQLAATNNELRSLDGVQHASSLRQLYVWSNLIDDIDALLDAPALQEGASVNLRRNCLDVRAGSDDRRAIDTLIGRGVEVVFDDQKEAYECGDRQPVILSFTATPELLSGGGDTVLAWDVGSVAPRTIWLEGLPYAYEISQPQGRITTAIHDTTTLTLHVQNDFGTTQRSVTVTVE